MIMLLLFVTVTVKQTRLLRYHFILKIIFLPRQARDKHRESTQNKTRFPQEPFRVGFSIPVSKTHISFAMPFYTLKMIVLPRQARDKRRESTQRKEMRVFFSHR
jgi:hypothetical protein